MSPFLVLLIGGILVLGLLKLDRLQAPLASRALWVPTVWTLVAFSKPLGVWFGRSEQGSMEAGSPIDRLFLALLLILAFFILSKRRFDWSHAFRDNAWLILLLGFMLLSTLWSPMPFTSLKRWIRELIAVSMAFVILSESDPRQALASVLRRITYILLPFSLILIKYYPRLGVEFGRWSGETMWRGVATQKNGLTLLCAISAMFLIWSLNQRRKKHVGSIWKYGTPVEALLLAISIYLMLGPRHTLTYSATSTVVLVLGFLSFLAFDFMSRRKIRPARNVLNAIVIVTILYGTVTPFLGKLPVMDISSTFERDGTLTGRADIWAFLLPLALKQPVVGHGFGGFWTTEMRSYTSSHAHNGFLDVLLDLGFLGLLVVSLFLLSCSSRAHRTLELNFDWGVLFFCYIIMATTHNIAESTVNSLTSSTTAVLMFFAVTALPARIESESPEAFGARQEPMPADLGGQVGSC
jgi:exopolysaccharide production protein ExoQ